MDGGVLSAETVQGESARYAAEVVCIPGLWSGSAVWRGFAGYLAHRGWHCHLLDVRPVSGGVEARGAAVAQYAAGLATPAILLGHDGGSLVALAAARRTLPAALVLLAPLAPGSRGARLLTVTPRSLLALVLGRPVPPPSGLAAAAWLDVPAPARARVEPLLAAEDPATMRDVVWGRYRLGPGPGPPALLVAGGRDRMLPPAVAGPLAHALGAELRVLETLGHWPLAGPGWQDAVAVVHRWLVQRLGESLLELHAEAMAERESEEEE